MREFFTEHFGRIVAVGVVIPIIAIVFGFYFVFIYVELGHKTASPEGSKVLSHRVELVRSYDYDAVSDTLTDQGLQLLFKSAIISKRTATLRDKDIAIKALDNHAEIGEPRKVCQKHYFDKLDHNYCITTFDIRFDDNVDEVHLELVADDYRNTRSEIVIQKPGDRYGNESMARKLVEDIDLHIDFNQLDSSELKRSIFTGHPIVMEKPYAIMKRKGTGMKAGLVSPDFSKKWEREYLFKKGSVALTYMMSNQTAQALYEQH